MSETESMEVSSNHSNTAIEELLAQSLAKFNNLTPEELKNELKSLEQKNVELESEVKETEVRIFAMTNQLHVLTLEQEKVKNQENVYRMYCAETEKQIGKQMESYRLDKELVEQINLNIVQMREVILTKLESFGELQREFYPKLFDLLNRFHEIASGKSLLSMNLDKCDSNQLKEFEMLFEAKKAFFEMDQKNLDQFPVYLDEEMNADFFEVRTNQAIVALAECSLASQSKSKFDSVFDQLASRSTTSKMKLKLLDEIKSNYMSKADAILLDTFFNQACLLSNDNEVNEKKQEDKMLKQFEAISADQKDQKDQRKKDTTLEEKDFDFDFDFFDSNANLSPDLTNNLKAFSDNESFMNSLLEKDKNMPFNKSVSRDDCSLSDKSNFTLKSAKSAKSTKSTKSEKNSYKSNSIHSSIFGEKPKFDPQGLFDSNTSNTSSENSGSFEFDFDLDNYKINKKKKNNKKQSKTSINFGSPNESETSLNGKTESEKSFFKCFRKNLDTKNKKTNSDSSPKSNYFDKLNNSNSSNGSDDSFFANLKSNFKGTAKKQSKTPKNDSSPLSNFDFDSFKKNSKNKSPKENESYFNFSSPKTSNFKDYMNFFSDPESQGKSPSLKMFDSAKSPNSDEEYFGDLFKKSKENATTLSSFFDKSPEKDFHFEFPSSPKSD